MNIIVCLDDLGGMLFHNRRQSQDALLRADVMNLIQGNTLWMNAYSARQFSDYTDRIKVSDDFLSAAQAQDFCFVENEQLASHLEKIDGVILYRWNRKYPADTFFPREILADKQLIETVQIPGKSHQQITREVYKG